MSRRRTSCGTILALLTLCTPAFAHGPTDTNPIKLAVTRGESYWPAKPCDGHVTVVSGGEGEPTPPPGFQMAMWVTFETPFGSANFAAPPSTYRSCVVHLSSTMWPDWQTDDSHFAVFCQLMTHEIGHFEGYPDTEAQPGTIQYEDPSTAPLVPPCRHYHLVYVLEHGELDEYNR